MRLEISIPQGSGWEIEGDEGDITFIIDIPERTGEWAVIDASKDKNHNTFYYTELTLNHTEKKR